MKKIQQKKNKQYIKEVAANNLFALTFSSLCRSLVLTFFYFLFLTRVSDLLVCSRFLNLFFIFAVRLPCSKKFYPGTVEWMADCI